MKTITDPAKPSQHPGQARVRAGVLGRGGGEHRDGNTVTYKDAVCMHRANTELTRSVLGQTGAGGQLLLDTHYAQDAL